MYSLIYAYFTAIMTGFCLYYGMKIILDHHRISSIKTDDKNKSKFYAVCGLMFGDEGKGKLVDALIQKGIREFGAKNTIVCGINGGCNAGHTTCIDGTDYHTHFLPSGAVSDDVLLYCGSLKVLEPMSLKKELDNLSSRFTDIPDRTFMSELIHYTTIGHLIIDQGELGKTIGTTGKGIGITYASKCTRRGLNLYDIVNSSEADLCKYLKKLYDSLGLDKYPEGVTLFTIATKDDNGDDIQINIDRDILYSFKYDLENIANFKKTWKNIVPSTFFKTQLLEDDGHCYVFEMSNAVLLDTTHGSYPNVTSSPCTPNAILDSLCLNLSDDFIEDLEIIGVVKSYMTRVGNGSLPTNIDKDNVEIGNTIVECGKEIGVTTGRVRTPGWLDIPALNYSLTVSGATSINLTRPDNFSNIDTIKICTHYANMENDEYPSIESKLAQAVPVYIEMPGWKGFDFTKVKTYDDLHPNVKKYISMIEHFTGVMVSVINTGKDRKQILFLDQSL
jgi:adenylosuccinate synthase